MRDSSVALVFCKMCMFGGVFPTVGWLLPASWFPDIVIIYQRILLQQLLSCATYCRACVAVGRHLNKYRYTLGVVYF